MANYDNAETTKRERKAAERQREIAKYNDTTLTGVADYNKATANNLAKWNSQLQNQLARKNADQTTQVAEYNAGATSQQFGNQLGNYDFANRQNAALRDTQFKQASRKSEAERFEAQRNLQSAALGLFGTMNQAMNGSATGNAMSMLRNRNDADNSTYWQNLQDNRNSIQNAYDESYNQNQVAKRDAAINAIKALQDIQGDLASNLGNIQGDLFSNLGNIRSDLLANLGNIEGELLASRRNLRGDTAANLNNINPSLYQGPWGIEGLGDVGLSNAKKGFQPSGSQGTISEAQGTSGGAVTKNPIYRAPGTNSRISALQQQAQSRLNGITENRARLLDYIMPENAEQKVRGYRNRMQGNGYFDNLVNGFNQ